MAEPDASPQKDRWPFACFVAAAAVVISVALQIPDDFFHAGPLSLITVGLALLIAAVGGFTPRIIERRGSAILAVILSIGLAVHIALLAASPPRPIAEYATALPFAPLLILAAALAAIVLIAVFLRQQWAAPLQRFAFIGLLAAHLAMGVWSIRNIPFTPMDVYIIQSDSADALLRGQNPYAITFPDLSQGTSPFFAPGIMQNGRLMFGYSYMPLSLLVATPGELLGNDIRYAQLACVTIIGALIGFARRGPWSKAAAALFLLQPAGFLVIDQGWVEPCMALMLAGVIFAACRRPRATPWMLGLFWASKQPVLLLAPLSLLLKRSWTKREIGQWLWKAAAVAAIVTLPLAVWDLPAFLWSAVKFQLFLQPFRDDALSYLAAVARVTGHAPSGAIGFVTLAAVQWLAIRRTPRTPAGFAAATALGMLVFYAFSRTAFTNYYWMIIAACLFSVAAIDVEFSDGPPRQYRDDA